MKLPDVNLRPRKLKSGTSWYLDYIDPITGKRERPTIGVISRNEAVLVQQKKIAELKKLVYGIDVGPVETIGLGELFQRYLDHKAERGKAKSTISRYERYRDRAVAVISELNPDVEYDAKVLSQALCELAMEKVQQEHNLSNGTYNNFISFIKTVYNFGIKQGLVVQNPAMNLRQLHEHKNQDISYYSEEELQKMWNHFPDDWKDLFQFLVLTGLRVGELQNLIWDHVKLDAYHPHIKIHPHDTSGELWKPKNGNSIREVPLNNKAIDIIKRQQGNDSDYVFSLQQNGRMLHATIYKALKRAQKAAGINSGDIHDFRRTFACRLAMKGINIYTLKDLMGHSSIKTTEKYIKAFQSDKQDAVNMLTI